MSKGSKMIAAALLDSDFVNVEVNGKMYSVFPPTIEKLSGAGYFLSDFEDAETIGEILKSINDSSKLAHAFSWLVRGNDSLYNELIKGTIKELLNAVSSAYSLISIEDFSRLSTLAKNVSMLIAKPK